jgi:alpha-2-macroglobulin
MPPAAPITIYFNRPMNQASLSAAWRLTPSLPGTFRHGPASLTFVPSHTFRSTTRYHLSLSSLARSASGLPLTPFSVNFITGDALRILHFSPASGTHGVPISGALSVTFNHPMVPLSSVDAETSMPRGWTATIKPAVPGHGSWLGASTWLFHPDRSLQPSTKYTVTVRRTAHDAWGQTLARPLHWSFTTITPEVFSRSPLNTQRFISPHTNVRITFNQPMDRTGIGSTFTVRSSAGQVPGSITWSGATLTFHPASPLVGGTWYRVTVASSMKSANLHATLGKTVAWSFRVAPAPQLEFFSPGRGKTAWASPNEPYFGRTCCGGGGYQVSIIFNTPMSLSSLDHHLHVSPTIGHLQTFFSGDSNGDFSYIISGDFNPSSSYTITIDPGVVDAFGRPLAGPITYPFKTSELYPSVALYGTPSAYAIAFSAGQTIRAPLQTTNIPKVHFTLRHTTLNDLNQNCGGCQPSGPIARKWSETVPQNTNHVLNPDVDLKSKTGSPLPAGLYWLYAEAPYSIPGWHAPLPDQGWPPSSSEVVVVNNVSITSKIGGNGTLVWVNDTKTGKPLKGVSVRIVDYHGAALATATTDAKGLHLFSTFTSRGGNAYAVVVNDGTHFGIAENGWQPNTMSPTFFTWPYWYGNGQSSGNGTYIYTDRPIYRTGQQVHFRALLWNDNDGVYSLPRTRQVTLSVSNPRGKQTVHRKLTLDKYGSVSGTFTIPSNAPTGDSNIWVGFPHGPSASTSFTTAEFRTPEFLTSVKSSAKRYAQGQTAAVNVSVRYVFGAPVTNESVHWTAYSEPVNQQPPGWDAYTFVNWESLWNQWSTIDWSPYASNGPLGKPIGSGTGKTNGAGKLTVHLPVNLKKDVLDRTVTVEVTATDANHQSVSGRAVLGEYHSDLAIGYQTDADVVPAAAPTTVHVVAVHQDGSPSPNTAITATISKRTYTSKLVSGQNRSTQWQPVPHDTPVATQTITTDAAGKANLTFTPADGGEYFISLTGADAAGNRSETSLSIDVTANGIADWGTSQDTSITLKPDRTTYTVGQTAHILVPSPFANATALVTVERGNIRRYWTTTIAGTSGTVDVPIALADLPNEYVTVTLYHGWQGTTAPEWRSGTAELHVRVDPRHVEVHLSQTGGHHHPGEPVTYTVKTTTTTGKPISTQISLALVDTAVLALKDASNADILTALYAELPLGVSTNSEGTISIDHLTVRTDAPIPQQNNGIDNSAGAFAPAVPATGGGGPGEEPAPVYAAAKSAAHAAQRVPGVTVRSNFADTAFWRGTVITNPTGVATVRVHLPDNTTTWRLDARGITTSQAVGQGTLTTLASRDLVLRPILPRFFSQGDHLRIGVALNNTLARPVTARVTLAASGLRLSAPATTVSVPAKGERALFFPASVPVGKAALLTARAVPQTAGVQGDAVQVGVPVHPPLTDETTATTGQVYSTTRQEVLVPKNAVSVPGALTVSVQSSITAGLGAPYSTLRATIYESNDDVAARVLAASSLHALPQPITGLSPRSYNHLPFDMAAGVQKLLDTQWYDGGWPWFTDATVIESDPLVTADAVQALVATGRHGRLVNQALQRAKQYLSGQLHQVPASLRAHLLYVLTQAGVYPHSTAVHLYSDSIRRLHLSAGSLADLGATLHRVQQTKQTRSIVASLQASAKVSATGAHWESSDISFYGGPPIDNTAEVLKTLLLISPNDPLEPATARWLMLARTGDGDGWDCSRDTAQAIAALAAYAHAASEGTADYHYRVTVAGTPAIGGSYSKTNQASTGHMSTPIASLHRPAPTAVDITRTGATGSFGTGPLYYLARLHYYLPANLIPARSEGVSVSRRFLTLAGHPVTSVAAGAALKVELTIHTDQSLVDVEIRDPLPSGTEPIDESLNTSQQGIGIRPTFFPWGRANTVQDLTWYLIHTDLRDDHVSLYAYDLPPGTYRYTYLTQATVAGTYAVPPTHIAEQFFPEVFGRSNGQVLTIR